MAFVFKIIDSGINRWLVIDLSPSNAKITWDMYGEDKGLIRLDKKPVESGNGNRNKNVATLFKDNEEFATLTFDKTIGELNERDKGKFGKFEYVNSTNYIQAKFYGKVMIKNGKFKEISLNYVQAAA